MLAPSLLLICNWYLASWESLSSQQTLSISGCWLIRLNSEFDFADPGPPIINILYKESRISDQFGLSSFIYSFVI